MKFLSALSVVAISVMLGACSSTGTVAPVENRGQAGAGGITPGAGTPGGTGVGSNGLSVGDASRTAVKPATGLGVEGDGQTRINETPLGKSVYFDYDQFTVKAEYLDMLRQNFVRLKTQGNSPIKLEGNADERGSSEYNLALGQKRAEAVKKQLELMGVPESQLEAVSFGKEKPRETCHEERCWAANRRVDLLRQGR